MKIEIEPNKPAGQTWLTIKKEPHDSFEHKYKPNHPILWQLSIPISFNLKRWFFVQVLVMYAYYCNQMDSGKVWVVANTVEDFKWK